MSITALILTQSVTRLDELTARYGLRAVERSIYATAVRLIAGDYEN